MKQVDMKGAVAVAALAYIRPNLFDVTLLGIGT